MAKSFFLIHNYKTLGSTLQTFFTKDYTDRFWGQHTFDEYQKINPHVHLNQNAVKQYNLTHIKQHRSIDHIHINALIELNILPKKSLPNLAFMMVVRNPIDRFISTCNFTNISPKELLNNLKNNIGDDYHQHKLIQNRFGLKIKTIKMDNKKAITNFFKPFGIAVDLSVHKNVSLKTYTIEEHLSKDDIDFLTNFYKVDFKLFRNSI